MLRTAFRVVSQFVSGTVAQLEVSVKSYMAARNLSLSE